MSAIMRIIIVQAHLSGKHFLKSKAQNGTFAFLLCAFIALCQWDNLWSPFCPFIIWVLGIKLRISDLSASTFILLSHLEAQGYLLYLIPLHVDFSLYIIIGTTHHSHVYCNYCSDIDNQRTTFMALGLHQNRSSWLCDCYLSLIKTH